MMGDKKDRFYWVTGRPGDDAKTVLFSEPYSNYRLLRYLRRRGASTYSIRRADRYEVPFKARPAYRRYKLRRVIIRLRAQRLVKHVAFYPGRYSKD